MRDCTSQVSPPSLSGGGDVINDFLNRSPVSKSNIRVNLNQQRLLPRNMVEEEEEGLKEKRRRRKGGGR